MKQFKLNIENREGTGRGVARRLRKSGRIPACVYGKHGARAISVSAVEFRDLSREIGGGANLLELEDDKGEHTLTLVRDLQRHPIKDSVDHIDFQEIERGHTFIAEIPVHLNGEDDAPGVRNEGGLIDHQLHTLEVRCRPSQMPEFIQVDASQLNIGDAVHVEDLAAIEGVEFLADPEQVIVYCAAPSIAVASTEEEEEDEVAADEVPASNVKSDEEIDSDESEDEK